jgi:hypothetical protein
MINDSSPAAAWAVVVTAAAQMGWAQDLHVSPTPSWLCDDDDDDDDDDHLNVGSVHVAAWAVVVTAAAQMGWAQDLHVSPLPHTLMASAVALLVNFRELTTSLLSGM